MDDGEVVVATENDFVYALDASNGHILWSEQVGTPVPAHLLPCGDIHPKVGITSTPVIDSASSEIFVVADEFASGAISHHLVGLSLSDGAVLIDQVVDPPGSVPSAQLQRSALTLADGQVIVSFGGNDGDCSTYHGWVVAVPETGGSSTTFEVDSTSGDDQGAIWMGGAAPAVDSSGNIWVATGNGSNTTGTSPDDSDSVIELSPTLTPLQSFTPSTWASDNADDLDLGSSSPALLADGIAVQVGKSENAYLLDESSLGGVGGEEAVQGSVCASFGGNAFSGDMLYIPCSNGVTALQITVSPPSVDVKWTSSSGSSGPPIVADGLVWTISQGGVLYGLDSQTGDPILHFRIGRVANHFPTPSFGAGFLLAPSASRIQAFTLG